MMMQTPKRTKSQICAPCVQHTSRLLLPPQQEQHQQQWGWQQQHQRAEAGGVPGAGGAAEAALLLQQHLGMDLRDLRDLRKTPVHLGGWQQQRHAGVGGAGLRQHHADVGASRQKWRKPQECQHRQQGMQQTLLVAATAASCLTAPQQVLLLVLAASLRQWVWLSRLPLLSYSSWLVLRLRRWQRLLLVWQRLLLLDCRGCSWGSRSSSSWEVCLAVQLLGHPLRKC